VFYSSRLTDSIYAIFGGKKKHQHRQVDPPSWNLLEILASLVIELAIQTKIVR